MTDITTLKAAVRKTAFANRKAAHQTVDDATANAHLQNTLKAWDSAQIFAAYMPIQTEVSPLETMNWLFEQGKTVCVPVIISKDQALEFHEWTPTCKMISGAFGAAIPKDGRRVIPDVIITPLVAFDVSGYRLGYGGGFYDRSFEQISAKKTVAAVGFAYQAQELPNVPTEPTDHRLDVMVTETGAVWHT
jgi:5-formyltetrahydrofolate cyclo-ligase